MLVRPDAANDFHARVLAGRLNGDHAAAFGERTREGFEHQAHLSLRRLARAERLGRNDQVVVRGEAGLGRNHAVEDETLIGAVDNEH